ncbi:MAG TPA: hypothetical protein VFS21_37540 [Roseiflexaceae bacterium]|nr:hypothetical protein [Roseiflexaceae bacterium]
MTDVGLHVAASAARYWLARCGLVGKRVELVELDAPKPPRVWLIVLEPTQSPLRLRFQLQRLAQPIVLVTEAENEAAELAAWVQVPLMVARPTAAPATLADLCEMAGSLASGSLAGVLLEGEQYV